MARESIKFADIASQAPNESLQAWHPHILYFVKAFKRRFPFFKLIFCLLSTKKWLWKLVTNIAKADNYDLAAHEASGGCSWVQCAVSRGYLERDTALGHWRLCAENIHATRLRLVASSTTHSRISGPLKFLSKSPFLQFAALQKVRNIAP